MADPDEARVVHQRVEKGSSFFQLGPILGTAALVGLLSLGAYFYREDALLQAAHLDIRQKYYNLDQFVQTVKKEREQAHTRMEAMVKGAKRNADLKDVRNKARMDDFEWRVGQHDEALYRIESLLANQASQQQQPAQVRQRVRLTTPMAPQQAPFMSQPQPPPFAPQPQQTPFASQQQQPPSAMRPPQQQRPQPQRPRPPPEPEPEEEPEDPLEEDLDDALNG